MSETKSELTSTGASGNVNVTPGSKTKAPVSGPSLAPVEIPGPQSIAAIGADPVGAKTIYDTLAGLLDTWHTLTVQEVQTLAGLKYAPNRSNVPAIKTTIDAHRTLLAISTNTPTYMYVDTTDTHLIKLVTS